VLLISLPHYLAWGVTGWQSEQYLIGRRRLHGTDRGSEGKQRNYVLNLNAEWGAGKTWFIKRWYMELKAHYPTVYIDAWQQDFSDDPLLTVISSIIDQLKEVAGKDNKIPEGMRQRLLGLFKIGGKLALKAAIKKAGLEDEDFSLEGEEANQLVDALCSNQKERYESIQYLKQEIRQWVEGAVALGKGELDYPAFILIDELDRCRPSYAVEMLETIKHIFDIQGVVFVLATDTEQLQHAIKVIYGDGFDAQNYLGRFFQRRFILNRKSRREFITNKLEVRALPASSTMVWPELTNTGVLVEVVTAISDSLELSLRQIEQVIDRLLFVISKPRCKKVNLIFLMYLFSLHEKDYGFYSMVAEGLLSWKNDKANENSFVFKVHGKKDINIPLYIKACSEIGNVISRQYKNGEMKNPFDDKQYDVSLREIMRLSYQFMFMDSYQIKDDIELSVIAERFESKSHLKPQENAILAKKELSLLECNLFLYRDLVELAIHLN